METLMATLTIPTSTTLGAYTFQVELDLVVYRFALQFNEREDFWYLTISEEDGTVIRAGVKVVVNFPLLRLIADRATPPGGLLAIDPSSDDEPGLLDLGDTALLTYVEEASLP